MTFGLNIEELSLANAAGLEEQFAQAMKKVKEVIDDASTFETQNNHLRFEINAKLKIAVDESDQTASLECQVTTKLPRLKARRQLGRMVQGRLLVDVEPEPIQQVMPLREAGGQDG